jgi:hypothetical protein
VGLNTTGYYSQDNVEYQTSWMTCIQQESGYALDYMGWVYVKKPFQCCGQKAISACKKPHCQLNQMCSLWNEKPQPQADYLV